MLHHSPLVTCQIGYCIALNAIRPEKFTEPKQSRMYHRHLCNMKCVMQAANVHAVLESGPLVQRVQVRLNDSISLIDDLDETLAIFDVKLRHMREDIAAIESRNNRYSPAENICVKIQASCIAAPPVPTINSHTSDNRSSSLLQLELCRNKIHIVEIR